MIKLNRKKMPYIYKLNNIRLFLLFFVIIIVESNENNNSTKYIKRKLMPFSLNIDYWNMNEKYIFYIDVRFYKNNYENILQILGNIYLINNLTVSEIDESIIDKNNSEIIIKEKYSKNFHIKLRQKPKTHYFEVLIRKYHKDQKYFAILVEPRLSQNHVEVHLAVSTIIQEKKIEKESISNGSIYIQELSMDAKRERFYKFIFNGIDFKKSNLILFIADKGVSSFYINSTISYGRNTGLFIIPKNNSIIENEFIIYLSLIGPANKTKFQAMLDDEHDIIYRFGSERIFTSYFIERLNCSKDIYIFEDYSYISNNDFNQVNHLDINSIYGDYELIYYENIASNITNIFRANNYTKKILKENVVNRIVGISNVLKLSCKKPTLLRLRYFKENIKVIISEGQEIIYHLDKKEGYYDVYNSNIIRTNKANRNYKFYFGYYKLEDNDTEVDISTSLTMTSSKGVFITSEINRNNPFIIKDLYHDKESPDKKFILDVKNDNLYFRLYLISNQYYKNVVEGLTQISYEEKALAFKIRKDIVFDYFIFKAYSYNRSNNISLEYDLKIIEKKNIEKDKVMIGMNTVKLYLRPELVIKYSNPYDKFNSNVKDDEYVYLLVWFVTHFKFYPIYVDIRYYYNNSIVALKSSTPEILTEDKEYKIYGNKNSIEYDKILLNINKCNCSKNYSMKTFYENNENLIMEENIINDRTFLFHDNLFNNTKLVFKQENNNDISHCDDNKNKEFHSASYYNNGDLYMNYFPINKCVYNGLKITNNFSITYEESYTSVIFKWQKYLSNYEFEYPVNYSIYILPRTSLINTICQMSLIPPNISLINKNNFECNLDKGKYKISIIASIVDEYLPLTTYYDFLEFEVHKKYNIKLIIIFSVIGFVLIASIIILIIYCKKKIQKEKINLDDIDIQRKTRLITVAKALGINDEQEKILLGDDEDDDNENLINSDDKLKEKEEEENNFSMLSDK